MIRQILLLIIGLLATAAVASLGRADRWEVWLVIPIPSICIWALLNPEAKR